MMSGNLAVEIVPHSTLIERQCTAGEGLGGVLTLACVGTTAEEGKQKIEVKGRSPVTAPPGASTFDSAVSSGLISGRCIELTVLGTLQLDQAVRLVNWVMPRRIVPALITSAKRGIMAMQHTTKCQPKIIREFTLPLTSLHPADRVMTELAAIGFVNGRTLLQRARGAFPLNRL